VSDKFLTTCSRPGSDRAGKRAPFRIVRHQSVTVPIYSGEVHGRTRYTISFFMNGLRHRRMFTDLEEAKHEAKLAAEKIQKGLQSHNDLMPEERESYLAVQRRLRDPDVPLVTAIEEYVKCRERLGDVPLLTAVEEYLRRADGATLGVSVAQVCDELVAAREQDGVSPRYRLQLRSTLGLFKAAFPGAIMDVGSEQIDRWLRESKLAPVTRNNRLTISHPQTRLSRPSSPGGGVRPSGSPGGSRRGPGGTSGLRWGIWRCGWDEVHSGTPCAPATTPRLGLPTC
jgi:hypothetical protein